MADPALKIRVYSDNPNTRDQVRTALGRRIHPDLPDLTYLDVATAPVVVSSVDAGGIDLAILDKRVYIGAGSRVGDGDGLDVVNRKFPKHLYTGITLVGKEAMIPPGVRIGRNCIVNFGFHDGSFNGQTVLADGESI